MYWRQPTNVSLSQINKQYNCLSLSQNKNRPVRIKIIKNKENTGWRPRRLTGQRKKLEEQCVE